MQATSKAPNPKQSRKGLALQPLFWTAGVLLTVWYLTPSYWYAQPTRVQVDATYRPATRL